MSVNVHRYDYGVLNLCIKLTSPIQELITKSLISGDIARTPESSTNLHIRHSHVERG